MDHLDYYMKQYGKFHLSERVYACLKLFPMLLLAIVQCSNILYPQVRRLAIVLLRVYDLSTPVLPESVRISQNLRAE